MKFHSWIFIILSIVLASPVVDADGFRKIGGIPFVAIFGVITALIIIAVCCRFFFRVNRSSWQRGRGGIVYSQATPVAAPSVATAHYPSHSTSTTAHLQYPHSAYPSPAAPPPGFVGTTSTGQAAYPVQTHVLKYGVAQPNPPPSSEGTRYPPTPQSAGHPYPPTSQSTMPPYPPVSSAPSGHVAYPTYPPVGTDPTAPVEPTAPEIISPPPYSSLFPENTTSAATEQQRQQQQENKNQNLI